MASTDKTSTRQFLSRDIWIKHCSDYKSSGLTQPDYAKKHGLNIATFRNWIHRLHQEEREKNINHEGPAFLPVTLNLNEAKSLNLERGLSQDILITLPNGIQCRFTTQHQPKLIVPWIEYLRVLP